MRHFWVDRITELELGVRAVGLKTVSLSEDVLHDHFPGNPVFPGVLLLEGMAQTAGVLLADSSGGTKVAIMVSLDRARFPSFARPGDVVRFAVEIESQNDDGARVRGEATVERKAVAAARFTFRLLPTGDVIPPTYQPHWDRVRAVWRGDYPSPDSA
jgi:3-hydroxyacyl-[acyl-carrier-protein] dehydratase